MQSLLTKKEMVCAVARVAATLCDVFGEELAEDGVPRLRELQGGWMDADPGNDDTEPYFWEY